MGKAIFWALVAVAIGAGIHVLSAYGPVLEVRYEVPVRIRDSIRAIPKSQSSQPWSDQQLMDHFWSKLNLNEIEGEVVEVSLERIEGDEAEGRLLFRHQVKLFGRIEREVLTEVKGKAIVSARGLQY